MEPISQGMQGPAVVQGPAVEDVQTRLSSLGYMIDAVEMTAKEFGATTAAAVRAFRAQQGLDAGEDVDGTCWSALVDESYKLGDRTLYLRLPNFHGADDDAEPRATITLAECNNLSLRIKTAVAAAATRPIKLRIELTGITGYGTFTSSDAHTLAVRVLDGLCEALSD